MKRRIITLALLIICTTALNAQFTKIGGGLAYGSGVYFHDEDYDVSHKTGNPALTFKGIYELSLPFHISPSASIFLPRVTESEFGESKQIVSAFLFDVNAHYVFNSLDRFEFYGLTGLNVTIIKNKWKWEYNGGGGDGSSESALGLNLGAGAYMKMTEQIDLFGEAKYIFSKRDQIMITAGLMLNIDWLKKNESGGL
jgi:opacity protein-like surface antigen